MEILMLILKIALVSAVVGFAVMLNVFIWGGIVAVFKRGVKYGNDKNIHKH